MPKIDLRITDKVAWLLSKPKRIKIAVGGRGSSKSIGVGDIMLMCCDHGERICAAREFQNSIDDSVHETLTQEIDRLGVEGFTVTNNHIKSDSGGQIFYKGLARNITSLKSLAGVDKLWIEEGESVSKKSLKVLTPSIRSTASANESEEEENLPEIWITMNRASSADAIAEKYLKRAEDSLAQTGYYEDDMCMIVEVNYRDNPWFPPELEMEREDDYNNLSREEYDHVWEGEYNDTVDNAIIKKAWFDAACDLHKEPKFKDAFEPCGVKVAAHDPMDGGKDAAGYVLRHGSILLKVKELEDVECDEGCDWALENALEDGADWFVWDGDGLGAGLKGQISRELTGKSMLAHMYKGSLSGSAMDNAKDIYCPTTKDRESKEKQRQIKDVYRNNRARYTFSIADRFYNAYRARVKGEYVDPDDMISIDTDGVENMVKFKAECCRIPRKPTSLGLLQVLSKKEMKDLEIDSPNMFDSATMSYANPPSRAEVKPRQIRKRRWK